MTERHWVAAAAFNLLVAVAAGAFGAHGLKAVLTPAVLAIWQTAVTYQMVHGLGLLAVALLMPHWPGRTLGWVAAAMLVGMLLFCGSLYLLALSGIRVLGAITPLGGVAFLLAWALLGWRALR
ncbi:DUF423 domain-containing protein [Chitiniphilus purpureus]|uniref:DUF423 domain-containing protein n=1 Tax=Chitiniphilus purpureus TaxID=2981137 RepID=A0ABY6DHZ1_9NEIS|nr:DUF423 domain-containing protein [Chitiniphilus sp. CD1]UXY13965.1 DUF423 domain-containing protein [Chitiniphilus sp. CD1]